jgi:2-dehydropantoate 2-reductase
MSIKNQTSHYLIIGRGRVARHIQYYFSQLNISFQSWHRQESVEKLLKQFKESTHILLLINDQAIDFFIEQFLKESEQILIHFSGSLISKYAYGTHPLMTFGETIYSLDVYKSIPFIIDHDCPSFDNLFLDLPNPWFYLNKALKPKYHALCVLSGNFSCMLWQKFFNSLEEEFNLPASVANSYLMQQTTNLLINPELALTGPLVRNDIDTINQNLMSLDKDPFQEVYQSFVSCYLKNQEKA